MTDTHTHIYMEDTFPDGGVEAAQRAFDAGVTQLIFPCVDLESLPMMQRLHERFSDNTHVAIGLHPTELGEDPAGTVREMERILDRGGFCAVGEVGIDLFWDKSRRGEQIDIFDRQLRMAAERGLPVLIHCREGQAETLDVIDRFGGTLPTLVFHSFTGNEEDVRRIRGVCDPLFGINGVVTFKNAPTLREALPGIGLDRIVLETDAPWLAPVPFRGSTNESSHIPQIRDKVAEVLGLTPEEVETATDRTAAQLYE